MKEFVKALIDATTISPSGSHFAVDTFGTSVDVKSTLNSANGQDPTLLKNTIDGIPYGAQRGTDIAS